MAWVDAQALFPSSLNKLFNKPFAANDNTSSNTYESSDRLDFYTTNM